MVINKLIGEVDKAPPCLGLDSIFQVYNLLDSSLLGHPSRVILNSPVVIVKAWLRSLQLLDGKVHDVPTLDIYI